jgi:hypothetical protein
MTPTPHRVASRPRVGHREDRHGQDARSACTRRGASDPRNRHAARSALRSSQREDRLHARRVTPERHHDIEAEQAEDPRAAAENPPGRPARRSRAETSPRTPPASSHEPRIRDAPARSRRAETPPDQPALGPRRTGASRAPRRHPIRVTERLPRRSMRADTKRVAPTNRRRKAIAAEERVAQIVRRSRSSIRDQTGASRAARREPGRLP